MGRDIPVFWYTTLDNLHQAERTRRTAAVLYRFHAVVLTTWYVAMVALVLAEFWDYWTTLI